jgi:hypothetical protein
LKFIKKKGSSGYDRFTGPAGDLMLTEGNFFEFNGFMGTGTGGGAAGTRVRVHGRQARG